MAMCRSIDCSRLRIPLPGEVQITQGVDDVTLLFGLSVLKEEILGAILVVFAPLALLFVVNSFLTSSIVFVIRLPGATRWF